MASFDEEHIDPHGECAAEIKRLTTELGRAYRAVRGLYSIVLQPERDSTGTLGYHSPTIAAAIRFVNEGSLDGSDYFIGKSVDVLHQTLASAQPKQATPTPDAQGG